ncbi:hypothetical protein MAR_023399, partial [Mya arenaria]
FPLLKPKQTKSQLQTKPQLQSDGAKPTLLQTSRLRNEIKKLREEVSQSTRIEGKGPSQEINAFDSHIKPFNPTEVQFVSFLTGLFKAKLGYDSLGTARSAVNQLLSICGGQDFSNSLLIHKLMKGFFELKPSFPKYVQIWDVKTVLNYLKQLPENLTQLNLSCKLCMLFLLLTSKRCQTLHQLNLQDIYFGDGKMIICINQKLKQTKPVKVFQEYMHRTEHLRGTTQQLLITTQKPYRAATRDTVSRLANNTNHIVFWAASTSAAKYNGVTLNTIIKTAGWSNATMFARFYNKPIGQKQKTVQNAFLE